MATKRVILMRNFFKDKNGSLTLEATIVFPFFLALMLTLINFVHVCMVYIAMDHAVSQTAKQIAVHSYPLKFIRGSDPAGMEDLAQKILMDPTNATLDLPQQIKAAVTSDFLAVVGNQIKEDTMALIEPAVKVYAQKKIREMYPLGSLRDDSFKIVKAVMFNPFNLSRSNGLVNNVELNNEDVALVVEYKVKLLFPFFKKELTLSNTAIERSWVDDK
ncbi:TadE/TadG family type IV pilus assembly protein [Thermincola potens]|uniref:TadE family protein n=1 Tax=Thermincola potens (strain JR) TaxID=635013 RepID=D5XAR9_THEPJ|nr:TadE/TadG family type IV pilus assembly protein [Thermincola potens]ADG83273.1 TadE family protein [Thermincola potens JR]